MARFVALMVVAALAGAPAAAASNPLLPQPAPQQQQPAPAPAQPQQAPTQTTADSGSLSGTQVLLIVIAVAALIGGIWLVIARDARRMTAGRARSSDGELLGGRGGSATRAARRSRKLSADERKRRKRGRAR